MKAFWFFVIFSPLLGIICAPFFAIGPLIPILDFLFYLVLDAGQKYLTITYYLATQLKSASQKDRLILLTPFIFSTLFMLGFYFQLPYLWAIFFYIVTFHFLWQIDWFLTLLINRQNLFARSFLQFFLVTILIVIHTSPTHFIALQFQKDPFSFESLQLFSLLRNIDLTILLFSIPLFIYQANRNKIPSLAQLYIFILIFFLRLIFYTPWLGGDPIFVFISIHATPLLFLILKKSKQTPIKTTLIIILMTIILSGIDVGFLADYLNLDLEYLTSKPTMLIAFGSSIYVFLQFFHIVTSYLLRKNGVIRLTNDNSFAVL